MHVFSVVDEAEFDPKKHVEKILGQVEAGDVTVACWEPGQISPYHCHPHATRDLFLLRRRRRQAAYADTERYKVAPLAPLSSIRRERCMNTPMVRSVPCYSASAMAPTWPRAIWTGAAIGLGAKRGRRRLLPPPSCDLTSHPCKLLVGAVVDRRLVLDAKIRIAALGGFALRHGIIGAILPRSGLQAEIVMDVAGLRQSARAASQGRREQRRRYDHAHRMSPL